MNCEGCDYYRAYPGPFHNNGQTVNGCCTCDTGHCDRNDMDLMEIFDLMGVKV